LEGWQSGLMHRS